MNIGIEKYYGQHCSQSVRQATMTRVLTLFKDLHQMVSTLL
jgi:hypothetical protein